MSLIAIKTYKDGISAHIMKAKLESEGITCFIFDEETISINPLFNFAIGGVKLMVNDFDQLKAKDIINEVENTPYTDNNDIVIKCPKCASVNINNDYKTMKDAKSFISTMVSIILGALPFYSKSTYKCKECDAEFTLKDSF